MFEIGGVYAFRNPNLRQDYGEWRVVRLGESGQVYARPANGTVWDGYFADREQNMAYQRDFSEDPSEYGAVEVIREEPVVEEDWS